MSELPASDKKMKQQINTVTPIKIDWPKSNQVRIRKVVSRSNHRVTGKYPSLKMGRIMQWESTLERDAFILMDVDPSVIEYHEQPAKISYYIDGNKHEHFPDVLVVRPDGSYFVEIKHDKDASKDKVATRTQLLSEQLPALGFGYLVLTETELRTGSKLENSRRLLRYGRMKPDITTMERIKREYFSSGCCCLGDILSNSNCNRDYPPICRMVLDGILNIDVNRLWYDKTPIAFNYQLEVK